MVQHPATDARRVLYRGGPVLTVDPGRPNAEAVATRGGRIVAVGSEAQCRQALALPEEGDLGFDGAAVIDLAGRALLPGFVDAHLHPMAMCLYAYHLDLSPATCIGEVLDALADRARATPP